MMLRQKKTEAMYEFLKMKKMYRAYIMTEIQRSMILDIIGRMVQYQSLVK